jgi:hypothetical protein
MFTKTLTGLTLSVSFLFASVDLGNQKTPDCCQNNLACCVQGAACCAAAPACCQAGLDCCPGGGCCGSDSK